MNVKGTAFLARKTMIERDRGEAVWRGFLDEVAHKIPYFRQPVLPVTKIPAETFLAFDDELVRRFFGGDKNVYWDLGERSAEWAFKEGPNKGVFWKGDWRGFLANTPAIWWSYFSADGELKVAIDEQGADLRIVDVPIHHLYFEYTVLGYLRRGLTLSGAKSVKLTCLEGFSKGDSEIHYRVDVA